MQNLRNLTPFRKDQAQHARLRNCVNNAQNSWATRPGIAGVLDDLDRFDQGMPLEECTHLAAMFTKVQSADQFARSWVQSVTNMIAAEPLAQPDHGHQRTRSASIMRIAKRGAAELTLIAYEAKDSRDEAIDTMQFVDLERHEVVLVGTAKALVARRSLAPDGERSIAVTEKTFSKGDVHAQVGNRESKFYSQIGQQFVVLRLSRPASAQGPVQHIRLSDGALLGQSSSDKRESCREVMMAVLGRMGRTDAVPAIAKAARDGSDHLRWQAVRQCLALDTEQGFAMLSAIAQSPDDPLGATAGAFRAQLIEAYPELDQLEAAPCPA